MSNPTFLSFNETSIPDEWYFERLRLWRDTELRASDWTQLPDAVCDKTAWATYREALRDLPTQSTDPSKLVFPTKP
jgi:hypothetical protein